MKTEFTPGPLTVNQPAKWPFNIQIVDASGHIVFEERRYAYGSNQNSIDDVMACKGFRASKTDPDFIERSMAANKRQVADAYLRAAAPELFEAAQWAANYIDTIIDPNAMAVLGCLRAAIAKATGA